MASDMQGLHTGDRKLGMRLPVFLHEREHRKGVVRTRMADGNVLHADFRKQVFDSWRAPV